MPGNAAALRVFRQGSGATADRSDGSGRDVLRGGGNRPGACAGHDDAHSRAVGEDSRREREGALTLDASVVDLPAEMPKDLDEQVQLVAGRVNTMILEHLSGKQTYARSKEPTESI